MSPPGDKLKLADPLGSKPDGKAVLDQRSTEDEIAEDLQVADSKKRIAELERSNAALEKHLNNESKAASKAKDAGQGKTRHVAHAEGWKAVCTAPDFCKVGKDVVAFNSFATLDQKHTASSNVKARGTAVYRQGDIIKNVQADAGKHIVSGTSLGSGHVKILDGHDNVKINGTPVARHDSRCLINCDASGVGGAQGKLVTEQKGAGGGAAPSNDAAPPGERTSEKLDALKKARAKVADGMLNLNAADEFVDFAQSNEVLDSLIAQIGGTAGAPSGYAAQVARGLLGFGKDMVMGVGELAYEGIKAVPKLVQLTHSPSGALLAQFDAKILAENIELGNITPATVGEGTLNVGKAIVKPITDPWAKGQYVESVTRGVTEVATLGIGWLKGSKAARAANAVNISQAAETAKAIELGEAAASQRPAIAIKSSQVAEVAKGSVEDGVHVKVKKNPTSRFEPFVVAEREKVTQFSNQAAQAEKSAIAARSNGDIAAAAKFDAIAQGKILEARKLLKPYVRSGDVQALLDRLDVSSPKNGAHFWSGWKDGALERASAMAEDVAGVSLETSPGGRVVNGWDAINKSDNLAIRNKFWPGLSEKYASGVEGTIRVVQSDSAWLEGGGNVWKNTELPQILKQRKVTNAIFLDLQENVRSVMSFEDLRQLSIKYSMPSGG